MRRRPRPRRNPLQQRSADTIEKLTEQGGSSRLDSVTGMCSAKGADPKEQHSMVRFSNQQRWPPSGARKDALLGNHRDPWIPPGDRLPTGNKAYYCH